MKNKIIKPSGVTLLSCLCIAIVADGSNLKIFRNTDDLIVEVPSKVEVSNGANLTLICQIENIKSKGFINGYVTWFIPVKMNSELKLRTFKNSSTLVFSNVNTNDEGLYVCSSLKFNVFKTLILLVKQRKSAELNDFNVPKLFKRAVVPGNGFYAFNHTDSYYDNRDLTELKNSVAKIREDLLREIENENKRSDYGSYDHDAGLNKHGHPNTNSFPTRAVIAGFVTLLAIAAIFVIICYCGYIKSRSSTNRGINRHQNTDNPEITLSRTNRCGHTSCSGNNLLNPAGVCRFQNNSPPMAPITFDAMDIVRPLIYDTENPTTQLDLPPTYSSSTHNSTRSLNDTSKGFNKKHLQAANSDNLNLPPSYDEAIGHKNNRHSYTASHHNTGHSHREDNDDVYHSAGDGFSGGGNSHSAGGAGDDSRGGGGDE